MTGIKTHTLIGQILVEEGVITTGQLGRALEEQQKSKERLGQILIRFGFIDEEKTFFSCLSQQLDIEYVRLRGLEISQDTIRKIPPKFASFYKIIPIAQENDTLVVASLSPDDTDITDGIGLISTSRIQMVLASEKDILEAIRKYYGIGAETIDQMMGSVHSDHEDSKEVADITVIESEASIGKFINQILLEAYRDRATDIHIEPYEAELKIRYRVDGVLYEKKVPANILHFRDAINSRIKIMSNLNIAENRLPQDGRFKVRVKDMDLDLRVSFLPTPFGQSVVIRILTSNKLYDLSDLGLQERDLKRLAHLIKKPHGIIFVTGPTGSGKTTTLYSCLYDLNKTDKKIITIEDPIEYQLRGITQVQINPSIGLTFASGLRSMLRHDPDIMMVGEVRDFETAEIAIQIALTGHLVFSTLHTNDAASGITRLMDMGIDSYLIASSVECFIAQRLVRRICLKCKVPIEINPEMIKSLGFNASDRGMGTAFEGKGCEACQFTGFYGREGIYEFLSLDDEIREMILQRVSTVQIKKKAVEKGMIPLLDYGWEKVQKGITSPSEIVRVTKEELI